MHLDYSPGYLTTCSGTYFGSLAIAAHEISKECLKTVCDLEALMPLAWDGWQLLIGMNDQIPSGGECRIAYERLRGVFSALHQCCVVEAQDNMFTASRAPEIEVRTGIIAEALLGASTTPLGLCDEHGCEGFNPSVETLRSALWVDPFAFGCAMPGRSSLRHPPSLHAPAERWADFARAAAGSRTTSRYHRQQPPGPDCEVAHAGTQSRGVMDVATRPVPSMATVVDTLKHASAPEPVAHIVLRCVTLYASLEGFAEGRCLESHS